MSSSEDLDVDLAPTERLHERLARALAREIVSGRMAAGEVFPPSEELTTRYGVSRTVARETTQKLASVGLIRVRHGKRTVINPVEEWHFLDGLVKQAIAHEQLGGQLASDLLETRAVLEIASARLCAKRATDDQLGRIAAAAEEMLAFVSDADVGVADRIARLVEEDLEFHRLIAEGSGNVVLLRILSDIRRELVPTWALDHLSTEELVDVAREHAEIAAALQARDPETTAERMSRHVRASIQTTLKRALPEADHPEIDRRLAAAL